MKNEFYFTFATKVVQYDAVYVEPTTKTCVKTKTHLLIIKDGNLFTLLSNEPIQFQLL
jgi:hypothetical protein